MPGWNHKSDVDYLIKQYYVSEDELWSLFNFFFSPSCKKTTTYKFCFLKSILDSLFSGAMNDKGYELVFDVLFEHFSNNYWNLLTKYHLKQIRFNGSSKSRLEAIVEQIVQKNATIGELEFDSLCVEDKKLIVYEIKKQCNNNVVGAMYEDFDGKLYGYNRGNNCLWLNPVAYEFLLKYKFEIEKLNYYEWAKMLEKINYESKPTEILDKLELSTPIRKDLTYYRDILRIEFEERNCFYCGKKLNKDATVDHVIPWKLVREDKIWNFVLSCKTCNSKKNDKIPDKKRLLILIDRNEKISQIKQDRIIHECNGYSGEMMIRLWNYAKIGGYKEYS